MTQRLRIAMLLTLAAVLVGITACGSGTKEAVTPPAETAVAPTASATESPSETTTQTPTADFLAPLTGLPVEKEVTNRPYAVMINNLAPARPQSEIGRAHV